MPLKEPIIMGTGVVQQTNWQFDIQILCVISGKKTSIRISGNLINDWCDVNMNAKLCGCIIPGFEMQIVAADNRCCCRCLSFECYSCCSTVGSYIFLERQQVCLYILVLVSGRLLISYDYIFIGGKIHRFYLFVFLN